MQVVASREGGVDRNFNAAMDAARTKVASREGGVDRNYRIWGEESQGDGRLPRGGRGSQQLRVERSVQWRNVASREGGVDRNLLWDGEIAADLGRLPRGGRGSQLVGDRSNVALPWSPPARGAWIATPSPPMMSVSSPVASREGGVDRNLQSQDEAYGAAVASREGGVDRNRMVQRRQLRVGVASREGGVDRNSNTPLQTLTLQASPPARGAWIATG